MYSDYSYTDDYLSDSAGWMIGVFGVANVVFCILLITALGAAYVALGEVFRKAGEKPWKAIIPVYHIFILFRICWNTKGFIGFIAAFATYIGGWIFMLSSIFTAADYMGYDDGSDTGMKAGGIICLAGFLAVMVLSIILKVKLSKAFGHGGGYAVGLIFLPFIFLLILGFGSSVYVRGSVQEPAYAPGPVPQPVPAPSPERSGFLRFVRGANSGQSIQMNGGDILVIGRNPAYAQVVVDDTNPRSKVSQRHCVVEYDGMGDRYYVTDVSMNGVYYDDGTRFNKEQKTPVARGTSLTIGDGIVFVLV